MYYYDKHKPANTIGVTGAGKGEETGWVMTHYVNRLGTTKGYNRRGKRRLGGRP